jgi:hypothetical protein
MKHGIIVGVSKSKMLFTLQKKVVKIMADARPRNSYKSLITEIFLFHMNIFINKLHWQ